MKMLIGIVAVITLAMTLFAANVLADTTTAYANVRCSETSDCPSGQFCSSNACIDIVCGISASSDAITFGAVYQGNTYPSVETTTVTNTGNEQVNPTIYGADWHGNLWDGSNQYWMPVESTVWSVDGFSNAYQLTITPTSIGPISPSGTATVGYKLTVPSKQPTDSYTQIITFTAAC